MATPPCRYSPKVDEALKNGIFNLGAPWCWLGRLKYTRLKQSVVKIVSEREKQLNAFTDEDQRLAIEGIVDQVLTPYQNRLTFMAYGLLLGSICVNAYLVTAMSHVPAMSAFVATLGGTLSGALGFQVDIQKIKNNLKVRFPELEWTPRDMDGVPLAQMDFPDGSSMDFLIGENANHLTLIYYAPEKDTMTVMTDKGEVDVETEG